MKISRVGEAPDYRFSLANERTFLALDPHGAGFSCRRGRPRSAGARLCHAADPRGAGAAVVPAAGGLAIYGYLRWLSNEKAMRLKQDLPYTRTLLAIAHSADDCGRGGDGAGALRWIAADARSATLACSWSARRWPGFARCWVTGR